MRKLSLAALAVAGIALATPGAHAQTWRPIWGNCVNQIGQNPGNWPEWASCVAQHLWGWSDEIQARYQACVTPIERERAADPKACNLCGNPTIDVINCMSRGAQ